MVDFRVDTEAINSAISKYREEIVNINNLKKDLKDRFDKLKQDGWDTLSGTEFMKNFENKWCADVEKYIKLIEFLIERLEDAINAFEEISDEAKVLQYKD